MTSMYEETVYGLKDTIEFTSTGSNIANLKGNITNKKGTTFSY